MKYTQEVKDKAVEAAMQGVHLRVIQHTVGPNPAATMRYLKKAGIDYNARLAELKEQGIVPKTPERIAKEKAEAKEGKTTIPKHEAKSADEEDVVIAEDSDSDSDEDELPR